MRLTLQGVCARLAHFDLLVTVEITAGVTGLTGPSGAGKTTLLDIIAGLRVPEMGRVIMNGVVLDSTPDDVHVPSRRRRIGYVPQHNALFPHLSVKQNILYGATREIETLLDALEIREIASRGVGSLSGGEQKRVALARAIATSPELLLLDEPLSGIDRPLQSRISELLMRIRRDLQIPMIYVTHDPEELAKTADEVVRIERGVLQKR